ncbi:hypothetical protein ACTZWW_04230 [Salinarimonas sp. NSM]|uniref:hypothetical protein n=1 Tax=Salinarimonas sp. NSM TaxID=3458003 RepID=UPI0040361F83
MITLTDHQGGEPPLRLGAADTAEGRAQALIAARKAEDARLARPRQEVELRDAKAQPSQIAIMLAGLSSEECMRDMRLYGRTRVDAQGRRIPFDTLPTHDPEDDCA